jgi:hypothetical protein
LCSKGRGWSRAIDGKGVNQKGMNLDLLKTPANTETLHLISPQSAIIEFGELFSSFCVSFLLRYVAERHGLRSDVSLASVSQRTTWRGLSSSPNLLPALLHLHFNKNSTVKEVESASFSSASTAILKKSQPSCDY